MPRHAGAGFERVQQDAGTRIAHYRPDDSATDAPADSPAGTIANAHPLKALPSARWATNALSFAGDRLRMALCDAALSFFAPGMTAACGTSSTASRRMVHAWRCFWHCAARLLVDVRLLAVGPNLTYVLPQAIGPYTLPDRLAITSSSSLLLPSLEGSIDALSRSASRSVPQ